MDIRRIACMATLLLIPITLANCHPATGPLALELVADGFDKPLYLTSEPGDATRLYVVEQGGKVWIVENGTRLATPFLDVSGLLGNDGGEQGLLGFVFHPDYAQNGYFYINYSNTDCQPACNTTIARYQVSADPNAADAASAMEVMIIEQPATNHNGGMLAFGPNDGYLYIATGDGGGGNDPNNFGQRLDTRLGKILRIDVDTAEPFAIPSENPQFDPVDAEPAIWDYGLRNPWRFSFDRMTGDLWIGDVGQGAREEINFEPADSTGANNYGWRNREGLICRPGESNCDLPGAIDPIHDYSQSVSRSVTGGYVYRGSAIPDAQGTYFFADYVSAKVWSLRYDGATVAEFMDRSGELTPPGLFPAIPSFGEDADGELYLIDFGGAVYRIVAAT